MSRELIKNLNSKYSSAKAEDIIAYAKSVPIQEIAFASSFSLEDMLITDILAELGLLDSVFYIDTGRLFEATLDTIARAEEHYGVSFKPYFPERSDIETYVSQEGINGFRQSVEKRKQCCHIRKIIPFNRALRGKTHWITGVRRSQSPARAHIQPFSLDGENRIKISPLFALSWDDLYKEQSKRGFPYNKLHDQGYPSIGCEPCTRQIDANADFRDGRWWWEEANKKECGLHELRSGLS
ncbi:MAG: phosphoadenylyl-sulfate reductase [Pseudobacteriovorax sp.]|nr:phosphoadenylyl-sulfate reductase [Pseudobacteriovorax sp.]